MSDGRMLLHQAGVRWVFNPAQPRGHVTDRPLYRSIPVTAEQAVEFYKLVPGDVVPVRGAASFAEDDMPSTGSVHLVLAPGSRAQPTSDDEWVVSHDLTVDGVERAATGPLVYVHAALETGVRWKYDPLQPRLHGKWVAKGAADVQQAAKAAYQKNWGRVGMGDVPITPARLAGLRWGTAAAHLTREGKFTPERQALHDDIIRKALEGVRPSTRPRLIMMGGGPASGKSAMVESGAVKLPAQHVAIDADAIKAQLPEVAEMKAQGDDSWASASHEESSYLAVRLAKAAYETNRHVVLDGTGDSSLGKLSQKIGYARAAGYRVEAHYITVNPDTAVARAQERARKTGRVVPESFIRGTHAGISKVFPRAANQFDSVRLYDNNGAKGEPLTIIGSSRRQADFQVHDERKWEQFLSYGRKRRPKS